jgi:hypothetical protein
MSAKVGRYYSLKTYPSRREAWRIPRIIMRRRRGLQARRGYLIHPTAVALSIFILWTTSSVASSGPASPNSGALGFHHSIWGWDASFGCDREGLASKYHWNSAHQALQFGGHLNSTGNCSIPGNSSHSTAGAYITAASFLTRPLQFFAPRNYNITAEQKDGFSYFVSDAGSWACRVDYNASTSGCWAYVQAKIWLYPTIIDLSNPRWGPNHNGIYGGVSNLTVLVYHYTDSQRICTGSHCIISSTNSSYGPPKLSWSGTLFQNATMNLSGSSAISTADKYQLNITSVIRIETSSYDWSLLGGHAASRASFSFSGVGRGCSIPAYWIT